MYIFSIKNNVDCNINYLMDGMILNISNLFHDFRSVSHIYISGYGHSRNSLTYVACAAKLLHGLYVVFDLFYTHHNTRTNPVCILRTGAPYALDSVCARASDVSDILRTGFLDCLHFDGSGLPDVLHVPTAALPDVLCSCTDFFFLFLNAFV